MCAADQWDVQATIQRLNELLIAHGYATWFDLTNMKGSTVDAMSDAIEGWVLHFIILLREQLLTHALVYRYCRTGP